MADHHTTAPAARQDAPEDAIKRMKARDRNAAAWLSSESEALMDPNAPEVLGRRPFRWPRFGIMRRR